MPLPPRHHVMSHVVIDRTLSSVPLFTGAFADDEEGGGYGMLEQWIPRIGNCISRESGPDVFQGDGLAIIVPTQLPGEAYREQLVNWVLAGGKLMVFDTPDIPASTANSLLMLFGLESIRNAPELEDEPLRIADGSAETPLRMSCEIRGGEPVALWGETPVASRIKFGEGTVTAVGFGSLFNDTAMGQHWLAEPDELLLGRHEVLYALLRGHCRTNRGIEPVQRHCSARRVQTASPLGRSRPNSRADCEETSSPAACAEGTSKVVASYQGSGAQGGNARSHPAPSS